MKQTLLALFLVFLPLESAAQWPFAQNAVFVSVTGQVTVMDDKGMARTGLRDSEVYLGETVSATESSQAVLRFFDGSTLELGPRTQLRIASLEHPTDREKAIRFGLLSGWVSAKVRKLMTASSKFEIEAGGVVCGVRGTQFSVAYEPVAERVDLKVSEGTVYATAGGQTHLLNAGEEMEFIHGRPGSHSSQDTKSAAGKIQEKVPDLKVAEAWPLSLRDLNTQFMLGISVHGSGLGISPTVSGTVQSSFPSIGIGGSGFSSPLNGIHLKLPQVP